MISDIVSWLVSNYGIVTAGITTAISLILFLKKWIKNAIRSFHLSNKLHSIFGDSPAEKIRDTQDLYDAAKSLLEARVSISEQWLKIGVYICDKDGACTWTNEHLNNIFGLDSKDMLGFGWLAAIDQDDRKRVNEEWLYSINNKIPYSSAYFIRNTRDNLLISIKTKALAVVDNEDEVHCYIGYLTEQSRSSLVKRNEKKKTEESPE
jgi:PAS domain-containing protein